MKTNKEETELHIASEKGDLTVVQHLVSTKNFEVNEKTRNGWTPVHLASKEGHLKVIKYLVKESEANVNLNDDDGFTPLHLASKEGHLSVVKYLVRECEANVKLKDDFLGLTPLHLASEEGHLDVVEYLFNEGDADVNVKKNNGRTPLHLASEKGNIDVVKCFVDEGEADVNEKDEDGRTPLHLASKEGHLDVVEYLFNEGKADINVKDDDGRTPLHRAFEGGHINVIKYFVKECEANVNLTHDNDGRTPLHLVSEKGHLDVVRYLVKECETNVYLKDNDGRTPLHLASEKGHLDVVRYLVKEFETNVYLKDDDGWTPLHLASKQGHLDVVKYLVNVFNLENIQENDPNSPFHLAYENNHLGVLEFLIKEVKSNVDLKFKNEKTLLHILLEENKLDLMKNLINEIKSNLKILSFGLTPFHYAIKTKSLDVIKFLVEKGKPNFEGKTETGQTCLHLACERGDLEILEYFLSKYINSVDQIQIDPTVIDKQGQTCFMISMEKEDYKAAQLIMKSANICNEVVQKLFDCCEKENLFLVDFLVKNYKDKVSLLLKPEAKDENVLIHAAKNGKLKSLLAILSFLINEKENIEVKEKIGKILHCKTSDGVSLIQLLISQGQTTRLFCHMIVSLEQEVHENIEDFSKCIKSNVGPSKIAMEAIKNAENHYKSIQAKANMIPTVGLWIRLILSMAFIPLSLSLLDITTDCYQVIVTWNMYMGHGNNSKLDFFQEGTSCSNNTDLSELIEVSQNIDDLYQIIFLCSFVILPVLSYFVEWFSNSTIGYTAKRSQPKNNSNAVHKEGELSLMSETANSYIESNSENCCQKMIWKNSESYLTSKLWWFLQPIIIFFWPYVCIIRKVSSAVQHNVKDPSGKQNSYKKKVKDNLNGEKAIMAEVCTESSFQPLLQLYLILPFLIQKFDCFSSLKPSDVGKLLSIIASVIALSFAFSSYLTSKTNGAIPKLSAGFIIIMIQCTLQITGRLILFTFLSYATSHFWVGFGFAFGHIVCVATVMGILQCICSTKMTPGTILLNSFANLYLQIFVIDEDSSSSQSESQNSRERALAKGFFKVQPTFWVEGLIFLENLCILITVCTMMHDNSIAIWTSIAGFILYLCGLGVKTFYLKQVHIWRHLNSFKYLRELGGYQLQQKQTHLD